MQYEIHVTVNTQDIELFKSNCQHIGLKPIVIETERAGEYNNQVMTSSKYTEGSYKRTLRSIVTALSHLSYDVLREKVEIYPEFEKHPDFIYYESHLRLLLPKEFDRSILQTLCNENDFHLSRNLFKRAEDFDYQMITYRTKTLDLQGFRLKIACMESKLLNELSISFDKVEIEECIYDSNISVDKNWIVENESVYL